MTAYLDTHVAVWLHDGLVDRLSAAARREIEARDLLISPMVLLEFEYLRERKRIKPDPRELFAYLNATFGIGLCTVPFSAVALEALSVGWTADPFDRIIVAQAKANRDSSLISADAQIRRHYERAIW